MSWWSSDSGWNSQSGWSSGWNNQTDPRPKQKAKASPQAKATPAAVARPTGGEEQEEEAGASRRRREENRLPLREEVTALRLKVAEQSTELSQLREVRAEHVAAVESGTEYKTMWSLQCNLSAANGKLAADRLTELDEETAVASKEARAHEAEVESSEQKDRLQEQAKQQEYQEFKTLHAMEFRSELKTKAGRQCWFAEVAVNKASDFHARNAETEEQLVKTQMVASLQEKEVVQRRAEVARGADRYDRLDEREIAADLVPWLMEVEGTGRANG
eukprot:s7152_g1.t1